MLFVIGEGVITQAERTETMLTWLKDPAFRPSLDTFCDFSAAESTPTTLELGELVKLIKTHAEAIGPKKLAVLAAKPVTFGVGADFRSDDGCREDPARGRGVLRSKRRVGVAEACAHTLADSAAGPRARAQGKRFGRPHAAVPRDRLSPTKITGITVLP